MTTAERSLKYIDSLDDCKIFPAIENVNQLELFDEPFPKGPADPEKIIIGGSVSKSSRFFQYGMMKEIQDFPFRNARENIRIEFSEMLQPGILGAAALCFSNGQ